MIRLRDFDQQCMLEPERPLKEWRSKFEGNNLEPRDLSQFFEAASPSHFTITQGTDDTATDMGRSGYDEQAAKFAIIDVIEEFICGDDPSSLFEKLKVEGKVSSVCGRVFKMGEPTYSCKECGMDPTCVLCVSCFKQSAHRQHRYKMGTSGGGGCCDCGDNEAWKSEPFCQEHRVLQESANTTTTTAATDHSVITPQMMSRCEIVFKAVLQYCIASLEIESDASIRALDGDIEEDFYCTVLYNDETHTFEQVIQTLTRIVGHTQKDAIEYVSSIDREGRAVVKCASFQACIDMKQEIEKNTVRANMTTKTAQLKVAVLHKKAVAYQQFALQLLAWFQEFISRHAVFRKIFCDIAVASDSVSTPLKHILKNDWKLWKTARTSWHRLLISGMLMEYENKKTLAIEFTLLYPTLMQEFIRDDHEHSFSVVSLSVQLFTVPTIAQHLIAHEMAFFKLMHTFYSESIEKYVKKEVLQFAKHAANLNVFKRAAYILFDLKYILSFKPDVWTDDLRTNFMHGVHVLMKLMKEMQGMDSVHRQTGQHMEYEPEWESAFNLHIKLAHVITLVLEWCGTDRIVLVKVYRMVLANLSQSQFIVSQTINEVKELADHSASSLMYDVASKHVSVHLPLSRFFAGLYLHLEKFDLTFDTISVPSAKPTPEQIIEPVLCTQTMIAQVHSGLWRRNGYSLLNQLYFYRNVKCRAEMLDRDVVVLQVGASLIESNEFLIHVLNKFNLINWAAADFEVISLINPEEDSIRQIINMVDEMLELLIVVVGERYMPGIGRVTEEDKLRKEITQQLCIKPFSHSELSRTLPDNQHESGMEQVIDSVAVFKKPTQSDKKGVYELRPECFEDYNMYFYHYTKEEKSKSEEAQRKRRREKGELVCCPPPKLPQLSASFSMLANLLQCDVMLLIMQTVLKRAVDLKARCFSESHLQKVLHLIGYAVQEQQTGHYPFITFYERAAKWSILPLVEELVSSMRVEAHRDLLIWTAKKYKELQPLAPVVAGHQNDEMESDDKDENASSAEVEKAEKEERARLAAERRAKIMAQMATAQKTFMSSNAEMFESASSTSKMDWDCPVTGESLDMSYDEQSVGGRFVALGPNRKASNIEDTTFTCILCSEDSVVGMNGPCMVYSAFVQRSRVLAPTKDMQPSPHIGSCGHVMHATCWTKYFENEMQKEQRRPNRIRSPGSFVIDRQEFLCPLCRCLSNAVLPIAPMLARYADTSSTAEPLQQQLQPHENVPSFYDWLSQMQLYSNQLQAVPKLSEITEDIDHDVQPPAALQGVIDTAEWFAQISKPIRRNVISAELKTFIEQFSLSVRKAAPFPFASEQCEPYLVVWESCAYTIEAVEMGLRATNKPMKGQMSIRQTSCLAGLVRTSGLLGLDISPAVAAKLINQLRSLLENVFDGTGEPFTEWNVFKMMVLLVFLSAPVMSFMAAGCPVPSGSQMEFYYLRLMFATNLAKIMTTHNMYEEEDGFEEPIDDGTSSSSSSSSAPALYAFYVSHNFYLNVSAEKMGRSQKPRPTERMLVDVARRYSETFLRCSCLLFHFMTDVELPDEFEEESGATFETMCDYLGLSSDVESYFKCDTLSGFMRSLTEHKRVQLLTKREDVDEWRESVVPCVPIVRDLVPVPTDYSDLINSVSTFTCPNNNRDDTRYPTICLACGKILCSMTYCCQAEYDKKTMVGACTYHAMSCGSGVGLFLRIRDCEMLLLGMNKGCFMSAPYLDEYGETDQGLRRGNPLRLCEERLAKLKLRWLMHGLHEDIARSFETSHSLMQTQWQNM